MIASVVLRSVEDRFLQYEKPRLDKVEPGGVRWSPEELDVGWGRRPEIARSLVRAKVVPHKIDLPVISEAQ